MKKLIANMTKLSEKRLIIYLVIVSACAVVTIINLLIENVGFAALINGTTDEMYLFLLSMGIVIVCVVSVVILVLAILQKRELKKIEDEKRLLKQAKKRAKEKAKNRK